MATRKRTTTAISHSLCRRARGQVACTSFGGRVFSIFVALSLCAGLLPAQAFAEASRAGSLAQSAAIEADSAQDGGQDIATPDQGGAVATGDTAQRGDAVDDGQSDTAQNGTDASATVGTDADDTAGSDSGSVSGLTDGSVQSDASACQADGAYVADSAADQGDALDYQKTTVHYLKMDDGSLLVLNDDLLVEYTLDADTASQFIKDDTVDVDALQAYIADLDELRNAGSANRAKSRTMMAPSAAARSISLYAEIPQDDAWIDAARYFNFICDNEAEKDDALNEGVRAQLIKDNLHDPAAVKAGLLRNTLPEGVVANNRTHVYSSAAVNDVQVHYVGLLKIADVEYVYYTTDHDITPNTLYSVLAINSSTPDDQVDSKNMVNVLYKHVAGHQLEYQIEDSAGNPVTLPDGWTESKVFGDDNRPLALSGEGKPSAIVPVNIPRGYTATLKAEFVSQNDSTGAPMVVPISYNDDDATKENKLNSLTIGVQQQYNDKGTMTHPDASQGEKGGQAAYVYVECTHEDHATAQNQGKVVFTVVLDPIEAPTFDASWWLFSDNTRVTIDQFHVAGAKNMRAYTFHGYKEQSNQNQPWYEGQYVGTGGAANQIPTDDVIRSNATVASTLQPDGSYTIEWHINGIAEQSSLGGTNGTATSLIDKLQINGEPITMPLIPEDPNARGDIFGKPTTSAEATTVLSSGTIITLKVEGVYRYTLSNQMFQVRQYTLTATNCYEDLTISGGRFTINQKKELIVQSTGIDDAQTWGHAYTDGMYSSENWWTQEGKWTEDNPAAYWMDLSSLGGIIDRTNDNWNANWFSDPIRFKRQLGYYKPTVRVLAANPNASATTNPDNAYVELQVNDTLTDDGQKLLGSRAVELVNLQSADSFSANGTVSQADAQSDGGGQYDYIGKANDGSNKWIVACGWANLVEDSSFASVSSGQYCQTHDSWSDSTDGYYYLRTTQALDEYMRDSVNKGQIVIQISAEPIRAEVQYENGVAESGTTAAVNELPSGTQVENMPYQDAATPGRDTGGTTGYNMVDNDIVHFPVNVPSVPNNEYLFEYWQLVDQDGNAVGADGQYRFNPGQTFKISDLLSSDLTGVYTEGTAADGSARAVFTLKAVWSKSTEFQGTKIPVVVNYHMVNNDGSEKQFYSETMDAARLTNSMLDVFADDGVTLNDKVMRLIVDEGGYSADENYMVYPSDENDGKYESNFSIAGVTAGKAVLDVYLVEYDPISITVKKTWGSTGAQAIPSQAVPRSVQVQLQKSIDNGANWSNVGNAVSLAVDSASPYATKSYTWERPRTSGSATIQYRVIELAPDGSQLLPSDTASPEFTTSSGSDTFKFEVAYDQGEAAMGTDGTATQDVSIANTYQEPTREYGSLKIAKNYLNAAGDDAASFGFEVALDFTGVDKNHESPTWVPDSGNVVANTGSVTLEPQAGTANTYAFNLANGQNVTLEDLPAGTKATVREVVPNDQSYIVTYNTDNQAEQGGITRTILNDTLDEIVVNNTRMSTFSLEKEVQGADGDANSPWVDNSVKFQTHTDFTFPSADVVSQLSPQGSGNNRTVTLTGTNGKGEPIEVTLAYRSGTTYRLTQELNNQDGKLTFDVPANTTYTTHEHAKDGYVLDKVTGGRVGGDAGDEGAEGVTSGTIAADAASGITFVNKRESGSLTISKEVSGTGAADAQFTFTLKFYADDATQTPVDDQFEIAAADASKVSYDRGTYTITLENNESATIGKIPAGLYYQVSEQASPDYTVQHKHDTASEHDGATTERLTISADKTENTPANTVVFTNTVKSVTVKGAKSWDNLPQKGDGTLEDGFALPSQVKVRLGTVDANGTWEAYPNDQNPLEQTISADTNWEYGFADLPRFDTTGAEISYQVREVDTTADPAVVGDNGTITYAEQGAVAGNDYKVTYAQVVGPTYGQNSSVVQFTSNITNELQRNKSYTIEYYTAESGDDAEANWTPLNESYAVNDAYVGQKITVPSGTADGHLNAHRPSGYRNGVQQGSIPYVVTGQNDVIKVLYVSLGNPYKEATTDAGTGSSEIAQVVLPGQELTYTVGWTNDTGKVATDVTITDTLPNDVTYMEGSASINDGTHSDTVSYDAGSNTITWTFASVPEGARIGGSFRVTVNDDGAFGDEIENKAVLTVDGAESTSDPSVVEVTKQVNIKFEPGDNGAIDGATAEAPNVERQVLYGNSLADESKTVPTVTPDVDKGYKFVGWKSSLDDAIYSSYDVLNMKITENVTFTAQYTLDATKSYTIKYYKNCTEDDADNYVESNYLGETAREGVYAGLGITLQSGPSEGSLDWLHPGEGYADGVQQGDVPYVIQATGDNVVKVLYEKLDDPEKSVKVNDGDADEAFSGDTLTYAIKWANTTSVLQDVTITDVVPEGTTLVEGSYGDGVYNAGNGTLTWTFQDVEAKTGSVEVGFKVTVDEGLTVNDSISNTAQVVVGNSPAISSNQVDTKGNQRHTVTFKPGDHGTLADEATFEVEHGTTLDGNGCKVPAVQVDDGWEFVGWADADGNVYTAEDIADLAITGDTVFTAVYKGKQADPVPKPEPQEPTTPADEPKKEPVAKLAKTGDPLSTAMPLIAGAAVVALAASAGAYALNRRRRKRFGKS